MTPEERQAERQAKYCAGLKAEQEAMEKQDRFWADQKREAMAKTAHTQAQIRTTLKTK